MKLPKQFAITGSGIINVIGGGVIIYLVVVLGQTIKHNYDMNRQIQDLKGQMVQLQDQKDELAYNIQYYKTDSFREREARAKLGLQLPGESVVIVPRTTPAAAPSTAKDTGPKSNLQQWLDFLKGRS